MHVTGRDLLSANQVSRDLLGSPVCTSGSHPARSSGERNGPAGRAVGRPLGSATGEASREEGPAHEQTGCVPPQGSRGRDGRGGDAVWGGRGHRGASAGRKGPNQHPRGQPLGLVGRWGWEMRAVSVCICSSMCVCTCILMCA